MLSRVAYIDCLLIESNRARTQGSPLSLVILEIDRGDELLRLHGDSVFERYVDQLAGVLCATIRQTDVVVKYTAWSRVFSLPNTPLEDAGSLAEKLRHAAAGVAAPWSGKEATFSAVVAQSSSRADDETEDRVTEWLNRAETGLEEVHQDSGNRLLALATP